jgi:uncharacterized protein with HEPN domain
MPRDRQDVALLWDMLQAARQIADFTAGTTLPEYSGNDMLQAAVERKLEIIGEAARAVSEDFRTAHPAIPWRGIISQRHFIAHEYGEIRQEKLFAVATIRIPELIALLAPLVPPETAG